MARALIIRQKTEMVTLIKKMRDMNTELKALRASKDGGDHPFMKTEAACQTSERLKEANIGDNDMINKTPEQRDRQIINHQ